MPLNLDVSNTCLPGPKITYSDAFSTKEAPKGGDGDGDGDGGDGDGVKIQ